MFKKRILSRFRWLVLIGIGLAIGISGLFYFGQGAGETKKDTYLNDLAVDSPTEKDKKLLDMVQTSGDMSVVKILIEGYSYEEDLTSGAASQQLEDGKISKTDFFRKLGAVDATNVSAGVMQYLYNLNYAELESGDVRYIEVFLDSMTYQKVEKANIYLEKLVFAGDSLSTVIGAEAIALLPAFPTGDNNQDYANYWTAINDPARQVELAQKGEKLRQMGTLTALFQSASLQEVGSNPKISTHYAYQQHQTQQRRHGLSGLRITDNGFTWERTTYMTETYGRAQETAVVKEIEAYNVSVDYWFIKSGLGGEEKIQRLKIIEQTQDQFLTDSILNAAIGGVGPGLALTFGVSNALLFDMLGINEPSLSPKEQILSEMKNNLFDVGGYSVEGEETSPVHRDGIRYTLTYDLQSLLAVHDLEANGLRAYIYRSNGLGEDNIYRPELGFNETAAYEALENFDKTMADPEKKLGGVSQETRDFLAGNSNQIIGEVSISNIWDSLEKLEDLEEKPFDFQFSNYIENNSDFFDYLSRARQGAN